MNDTLRKPSGIGHSHVLCVGDFNYPKIDWDTHSSSSWNTDDPNYLFIECMHDCYWYQHVNEPTRGRGSDKPSVLDLVLSNEVGMVDSVDIEAPLGASDHGLINITFRSHIDEEPPKLIFQYEKADYNKMRELLDVAWQEVFSEPSVIDNIDEQWNIFSKRYYEAEKICVPVRRLKTGRKRFAVPLDRKTLAKRRKKHSLWKKYIESQEGQIYVEYRRCSNQLRRLTCKATKIYEKKIAKEVKKNPKMFWKYAANKTKVKSKVPDLYLIDEESPNDMTSNDQEKAEKLSDFFASVFTNEVEGVWELANKPDIKRKLVIHIDGEVVSK